MGEASLRPYKNIEFLRADQDFEAGEVLRAGDARAVYSIFHKIDFLRFYSIMLTDHLPETSIVSGSRALRMAWLCAGNLKSRWHQASGYYVCIWI